MHREIQFQILCGFSETSRMSTSTSYNDADLGIRADPSLIIRETFCAMSSFRARSMKSALTLRK